ncbi:MAG: hypothetical protein ACUVTP_12825, partial [Candidatus Fervidibacter sp.]|uniref:hypothetical protein n=1 Tax=Candidatus Fervidibacter sp. TaxID=3100871 RepID=UPI0040494388
PGGSEGNHRNLSQALATDRFRRYIIPDFGLGYPLFCSNPLYPLAGLSGKAGHSEVGNTARRRLQERLRTLPLPRGRARLKPEFAVFILIVVGLEFFLAT